MRLSIVLATVLTLLAGPVFAPAFAPAFAQPKPTPAAAMTNSAPALVDVNSASADALAALPGIGDVRSKAIIAGRPYAAKTDLVKNKVLTQGVYDGLSSKIALANINTTSAKDMATILPGIGDARSAAIVKGRPYTTPTDLVTKKILTQLQYDAIKTLITTR